MNRAEARDWSLNTEIAMNMAKQKNSGITGPNNCGAGKTIVASFKDNQNATFWAGNNLVDIGLHCDQVRMDQTIWQKEDQAIPKRSWRIPQSPGEIMNLIVAPNNYGKPQGFSCDTNHLPKEPLIIADSSLIKKLKNRFHSKLPEWLIVRPEPEENNIGDNNGTMPAEQPLVLPQVRADHLVQKTEINGALDVDEIVLLKAAAFGDLMSEEQPWHGIHYPVFFHPEE
jgi:hypothetical protein